MLMMHLFDLENQKPLTPENTLAVTHHDKQKQVEVKRSSRANPHSLMDKNKPTAGRTKAIHRRLELSFNLYLLLLLWVKTELPKTAYI